MSIENPIQYDAIFDCIGRIDRGQPISVLLSSHQASLFKRHLEKMCNVPKQKGLAVLIESITFNLLQFQIALSCPKILGLGHYYDIDQDTLSRVRFDKQAQNQVLVTFVPRSGNERKGRG